MSRSLLIIFIAGLLLTTGNQQLLAQEFKKTADAQWESLFDGKSTAGWRDFKGTTVSSDSWQIKDGCLVSLAKPGNIVTDKKYSNFELEFEWKVTDSANSGVFYRVTEDVSWLHHSGLEYQILDNQGQSGRPGTEQAAACYGVYAAKKDVTRPVGQWNQGRIVVIGNRVEHHLNGEKLLDYEIGSADYQTKIAAGPLRNHPKLAKQSAGHIALQNYHGHEAYFRNLRIKELAVLTE